MQDSGLVIPAILSNVPAWISTNPTAGCKRTHYAALFARFFPPGPNSSEFAASSLLSPVTKPFVVALSTREASEAIEYLLTVSLVHAYF
jgi:hypothetical protein